MCGMTCRDEEQLCEAGRNPRGRNKYSGFTSMAALQRPHRSCTLAAACPDQKAIGFMGAVKHATQRRVVGSILLNGLDLSARDFSPYSPRVE